MRVFAGIPILVVTVLALGLSACGQRGPLILPNDTNARDSKAIYIIPQKTEDKQSVPVAKQDDKPIDSEKVITQ